MTNGLHEFHSSLSIAFKKVGRKCPVRRPWFSITWRHSIRRLKATGTFHEDFGWNENLLLWFINYFYSRKCKKNAKLNGLVNIFWILVIFFLFTNLFQNINKKNATRIQNILTHSVWASVWHFLTFLTIKVVIEP